MNKSQLEIPDIATEAHLVFLDGLRESGVTNMYGARPYLMDEFPELSEREASAVLSFWMRTFAERHDSKGKRKLGE